MNTCYVCDFPVDSDESHTYEERPEFWIEVHEECCPACVSNQLPPI